MGAEDHAYFQAVEEVFVRLRGAPLLLSPKDWMVAREWHRRGIPLSVVENALEELFSRRRDRGARGRVQSLGYCAPAVESAWEEIEELQAPGRRETASPSFDVELRLAALAAALPADLAAWRHRLLPLQGEAEIVEARLAELDVELDAELLDALSASQRQEVEVQIAGSFESLAQRLPKGELEEARRRLTSRWIRRQRGVPVLSLFAPEAESAAEVSKP
ncbi:MAG: hypothetical protein AAF604_08685 [Acidobacteriota bacterium]